MTSQPSASPGDLDAESASRFPPSEWNDTARAYPGTLLHEAFEEQVARTPDAPAVSFRDETLSYRELDARVNRLAHRLIELGAQPDMLVGVCMERSVDMVVSLYAVLKAGAAYVPIDPEYPVDRIEFMVEDAQAPILVTRGWLAERFEESGASVVSVDDEASSLVDRPPTSPGRIATPDDLAYVIYTSGSTGRPKGAMISHQAIANRIDWMQEYFRLTAEDRVLQKTPFSFDVSVWEFFWPLLNGAELVVAEPGGHRDSSYLAQVITERNITTIHFVPSMLQLFLEDSRAGDCTSLRRVVCSGEALSKPLQDHFFGRLDAELHNLYGPTEAAVDVTAWICDRDSPLSFVPIGTPVGNTQIHILDADLRSVPVGTAGRLHIGGVQVARGYHRRPDLTAERFVKDPFRPSGRLYDTGDLARYLADGNIEFLGRSDFQVKIRGFRVELGEIEAALASLDGARQAVVEAHQRADGDLELVAYVAHSDPSSLRVDQLKAQLAASLPEYMVPTTIIPVERFELTPNGKIDRKALPKPERVRPELNVPFAAPRSPLETRLAEAWRRLLDVDRVGRDDRFFELGGTSLQAARFVNQMQSQLGESIFVVSLFSAPSVAEYAAFLEVGYPAAVARLVGAQPARPDARATQARIDDHDLDRLRSVVPVSTEPDVQAGPSNPPAIFILSPPRSGTTLLRIMLAGHPDLFAASELQLLGFAKMSERAQAYSGRFSNWLDGTVRSLMDLEGIDAATAKSRIAEAERDGMSTKRFFGRLQEACAPRTLVDKSPSYALDPQALRKAERDFEGARYIHLVRNPAPMVDSFERHHMEQVLYLRQHPYDSRQLAELVWTLSHRNIIDFLADVPADRQHRLTFEELVRDPEAQTEGLCRALGLRFDRAVTQPYDDLESKMVDGVYAESAPMGDPNFVSRGRIDQSLAEAEQRSDASAALGDPTLTLAAELGYRGPADGAADGSRPRTGLALQRDRRRAARARRDRS